MIHDRPPCENHGHENVMIVTLLAKQASCMPSLAQAGTRPATLGATRDGNASGRIRCRDWLCVASTRCGTAAMMVESERRAAASRLRGCNAGITTPWLRRPARSVWTPAARSPAHGRIAFARATPLLRCTGCRRWPAQRINLASVTPRSAGDFTVVTPAFSSAANLAAAVPLPPLMMAPAWPMRLPAGAEAPAMNATTGLRT